MSMQKRVLMILTFLLVLFSTIAYSGLAVNMSITGEATIRAVSDIRVTDTKRTEALEAIEQYNSRHTKNTVTTGFLLSNSSSSITYEVEVTNKGDIDQAIYSYTTISNNDGLTCTMKDANNQSATKNIIEKFTTKKYYITCQTSTPSNEVINAVTSIDFREVYYITFDANSGTSSTPVLLAGQTKFENETLTLTNEVPTKTGHVFVSWNTKVDGTGVSFAKGGEYSLNSDKILYAQYKYGTYTITLDGQGATTQNTVSIFEKYNTGFYLDSASQTQMTTSTNGISIPVKDGYQFGGYYTQANGAGTQFITAEGKLATTASNINFTENSKLYAKWTPYKLTINYYANGATKNGNTALANQLLRTDTINYDATTLAQNGLPNYDDGTWTLTKDGYHATKYWHVDDASSNTKINENTTYAKSQNLADAMNKLDGFKVGDVSVNVYAGWEANTYTVTYNSNKPSAATSAVTGSTANSSHTYDQNKALTTNGYSLTGYTFNGWKTKTDGTGTNYTNSQSVKNLTTENNGTVTLYAKWTLTNYTITYNLDGGHIGTECASENGTCTFSGTKNVCYGSETTYICMEATNSVACNSTTFGSDPTPGIYKHCYVSNTNPSTYTIETNAFTLNTPTKYGYTFAGWTGSNGSTAQTDVSIAKGSYNNKTYTATYTPKTYTLTFNPDGGTYNGSTSTASKTMTFGTANNNSVGAPTKTGYTFTGWYSGSTQVYNALGQNVNIMSLWTAAYPNGTWRSIVSLNLTAKYSKNPYTVKYASNKPSGASTNISGSTSDTACTYDEACSLTSNGYTLTGYTFTGWNTAQDGSGTSYSNTASVTNLADSGETTLYAQWIANTYTMVYNQNKPSNSHYDVTGTTISSIHAYDTSKKLTKNGYSLSGYTFTGWNTEADGSGTSYTDEQSILNLTSTNDATINLYAQWSLNTYNITYTMNGGTVSTANPTTYNVNTTSFTLNNPTKTGWTFDGWSGTDLTGNSNKTVTIAKGSTGNRNYTAHFSKTITLTQKHGTTTTSQSYTLTDSETSHTFTLVTTQDSFDGWTF